MYNMEIFWYIHTRKKTFYNKHERNLSVNKKIEMRRTLGKKNGLILPVRIFGFEGEETEVFKTM